VSAPVKAAVLYDNLSASSDGADGVTSFGPLYDSFKTGTNGFYFTHLGLMLGGGNGGSLNVGLYGNQIPNGGPFGGSSIPDGLITNIATLNVLPAGPAVVSLDFSAINLSANTRYWIGLSSTDSNALWYYSFDFSGTGVGGEFFFNSAGVFPNDPNGGYQMLISGTETPLPAALPLFAGGGGVLGLLAWRRKRKAEAVAAVA
jgi:hypothetical protein